MSGTTQTSVAPAITDAVTQANVKNLADAPAMAMGHLYQTMAHSTGLSFENAVNAQHQLNMASQASTVTGVSELYTVDTAEQAVAAAKLNVSDLAQFLGSLIVALKAATGFNPGGSSPIPKEIAVKLSGDINTKST